MKLMAAARMRRTLTRKVTRASAALSCALALICAGPPALAVEPAGGPPYPPGTSPEDDVALDAEAPDASVDERGWLASSSADDAPLASGSTAPGSSLLTLLALLLLAGLGGSALWLQRRKKAASPSGQIESKLTLLSSTRVGPKAFAVSAEINGRVLLLGVTDHTVTNLGWLDPPELEAAAPAEDEAPDAAEPRAPAAARDDLPDDYPGSALRAAAAAATQQSELLPPSSSLTSSQNLRRFQEVLRGVVPARRNPLRAPSTPPRAELPSRPNLPLGSDPASTLAALTSDIVPSGTLGGATSATPRAPESEAPSEPAAAARSVAPASLRRKRQRRQEQLAKPAKAAAKSATAEPAPAELEGQVAGLRALKNG